MSEVKVGQEVWVSNKTINRIWEAKIIGLDKNLGIFLRYINHEYKGHITTPNITGKESFLKVTTNKPHRDFSDCPHWEDNPKANDIGEGLYRVDASYCTTYKREQTRGYKHMIYWYDYEEAGTEQTS